MASRGQKKKRQCGENFINNKRPLNPTHISLKKEKQLETKTTRRAVLMSQFDDDEKRDTLQKKQRKQEDIAMKGNIDPQQVTKLLKRQQQQHQRQKEKSISPKSDPRLPISPKQEHRFNGQEYHRLPKKEPESQAQQSAEDHI